MCVRENAVKIFIFFIFIYKIAIFFIFLLEIFMETDFVFFYFSSLYKEREAFFLKNSFKLGGRNYIFYFF